MVKNKVDKLIPHQMQWDQHDSVRYQDAPQEHKHPFAEVDISQSAVLEKQEKQMRDK